jgi:hypothetical protein
MSSENLQHFIDNHPAIFPIYLVLLWLLVGAVLSLIGGWFSLSKLYRTRVPFNGLKLRMQRGRMRWFTNYNNVLTLGANQQGLYLASMFLFRFMQPPLLIPWAEVKVRRTKGWIFEYATFTVGRELSIPLRIRSTLADNLRDMAGNCWPVEET